MSLEQDVRAICPPRGRRVAQPGHSLARRYLLGRLEEIGVEPFAGNGLELPYRRPHPARGSTCGFVNLVGRIPGRDRGLLPLLVGAHYDSVIDAPCADDNAAAVAITLAIAASARRAPLARDLIVALFDAEEPPFFLTEAMGSLRFWRDHCQGMQLATAITLDLVGHDIHLRRGHFEHAAPPAEDLLFVIGSESHPRLQELTLQAARDSFSPRVLLAPQRCIGDMSDYHAFRQGGQPYLFLTCGQSEHYHTEEDRVEKLNFRKIRSIAGWLEGLMRSIDARSIQGPAQPCSSVAAEAELLERTFGAFYEQMLTAQGFASVDDPKHVDRLVHMLRHAYFI